jgi:hypothetical protein
MPTLETDIAKQQAGERLVHLLEEWIKLSVPATAQIAAGPKDSATSTSYPHYLAAWEAAINSISIFPYHHGSKVRFRPLLNEEAIKDDWKAVGHDLYTAMLQYTIAEHYCHGRSCGSASDNDNWTISFR